MTVADDDVGRLAFDLIAPARTPDAAVLAAMGQGDWQALTAIARQHRILPLLHARLRDSACAIAVPDALCAAAADNFTRKTMSTIAARRTLVLAARALSTIAVEPVAMKGAYLAFHAYAEAGMRPLRDIDLLVPLDRAEASYACLLANGFAPVADDIGDIAAYLTVKHQLPALRCALTGTVVELHHRAFHGHPGDPDIADAPDFAERLLRRAAGERTITYMGPEHLLLHLIVHSAHDHRFDNGPGIFADVAALLVSHNIDWPRFWALADRYAAVRAALVVLRMAEQAWGVAGIDWGSHRHELIPPALLDSIVLLSLRDLAHSADLARLSAMDRRIGLLPRARYLLGKLLPSPTLLRAAYANRGQRRELPGLYLRKWSDLTLRRLPSYAGSLASAAATANRVRLGQLDGWLADQNIGIVKESRR